MDVSPLQYFTHLSVLWLSGNSGIDFAQLQPIINQNYGLIELGIGGINVNAPGLPFFNFDPRQLNALDVSGTGIELLGGISQYENLKRLDASDNTISSIYELSGLPLTELRLTHNQIVDVSPLLGTTQLKVLWLSGNSGIDFYQLLSIINQNQGITELGLGGININSLGVPDFGYNPMQLIALDISSTGIDGLWGIEQYSNLQRLNASDNAISDLYPLNSLPLTELRLANNKITDVWPLQSLSNLKVLWMSGNSGIDFYSLKSIIDQNQGLAELGLGGINFYSPWLPGFAFDPMQLTALDISNTGIEELWGIEMYVNLKYLDASNNRIVDLYPLLGGMYGPIPLTELRLGNNRIVDVTPLQTFTQLQVLWLSGNSGIDFLSLKSIIDQNQDLTELGLGSIGINAPGLPWFAFDPMQLTALDVSNAGLTGLLGIEQYINLQYLNASNNSIVDVSPLQYLFHFKVLWLSGNSGINYMALEPIINQNQSLTELGLGGIMLDSTSGMPVFAFNPAQLIVLDISNTGIVGLWGIEQYINLQRLDASNNNIVQLYALNGLPLKELRLANNQIVDVWPLQSFYDLEVLWLSGNSGIDFMMLKSVIDQNQKLTELGLGSINLNSYELPYFAFNPMQLVALDISNTGIQALWTIEQYVNLQYLDASNNNLWDISSLMMLQGLTLVDLHGSTSISCAQLDNLEMQIGSEVLIRPETCVIGYAPNVVILSPYNGSQYIEGMLVNLVADAYDYEEGEMTAVIDWSSDLSGALGVGSGISVQLMPGLHTITASVVDSDGNAFSDSIHVEVFPNSGPTGY
jgi:Leucine-rich repeat (LRR) protein